MKKNKSQIIIYKTEDGQTRIEVRFDGETVWLPQSALAELFQTTKQNIICFNNSKPLIEGRINNIPTTILLDTGSSYSLISEELYKQLSSSEKMKTFSGTPPRTANNKKLHITGEITLTCTIQDQELLFIALVSPNLLYPCILGFDSLKKLNVLLQFSDCKDICSYSVPKKLEKLLSNYSELFSDTPSIAKTSIQHEIDVQDHNPIHSIPYRISKTENDNQKVEIERMLEDKVIRPSKSSWSSPVVLIPKKDGTKRFCVDYRKLNSITRKDLYPLPRIDDILDSLGKSKIFSTLDLRSGYWQLPVVEKDKEKTAFISKHGLFEFNVMPFGLCNAPATFQRAMDQTLKSLIGNCVYVYLDDVIIYSNSLEQHYKDLEKVFQILDSCNFKIKLSKCDFAKEKLRYLGHIISVNGIQPDPEKIKSVQDFPEPRNIKQLQRFLGLCNYYRRYIEKFSVIADPLYHLLRKNNTFNFNQVCRNSFNILKDKLISSPILSYPDSDLEFYLNTDASTTGLGAILSQKQNNKEVVIQYLSRTLNSAERKYSTSERECLATVWAVKSLRPYLLGSKFTIITDHSALQWLYRQKDPTGKLGRWSLILQSYTFTIQHRPCTQMRHADVLSRINSVDCITTLGNVDFEKKQREDPELNNYFEYLERKQLPYDEMEANRIVVETKFLILENGILYHLGTKKL